MWAYGQRLFQFATLDAHHSGMQASADKRGELRQAYPLQDHPLILTVTLQDTCWAHFELASLTGNMSNVMKSFFQLRQKRTAWTFQQSMVVLQQQQQQQQLQGSVHN